MTVENYIKISEQAKALPTAWSFRPEHKEKEWEISFINSEIPMIVITPNFEAAGNFIHVAASLTGRVENGKGGEVKEG